MLLADAAEAVNGKLYILGGGWSLRDARPIPIAIALLVEVPWTQANIQHLLQIDLVDEDGRPVIVEAPTGPQPFQLRIPFEVGRPAGLQAGTPLTLPLAINLAPIALQPARRYVLRCSINGDTQDHWQVSFATFPQSPPPVS